jgi:hypothetical protein
VHVPDAHSGEPLAPVGQATQAAPQAVASSSRAQSAAHLCRPVAQVKSHFVPSHVAASACAGTAQAAHDVPHEFTSSSDEHRFPHACVPIGQAPSQAAVMSMQVPWQSFLVPGHAPSQARATQVAVPPTGSAHRVHDVPHDFGSSELTHAPEQRCSSAVHVGVVGTSAARSTEAASVSASASAEAGASTGASALLSLAVSADASFPL